MPSPRGGAEGTAPGRGPAGVPVLKGQLWSGSAAPAAPGVSGGALSAAPFPLLSPLPLGRGECPAAGPARDQPLPVPGAAAAPAPLPGPMCR